MKSFNNWLKLREMSGPPYGPDTSSDPAFDNGDSSQTKAAWKLADISWSKFPNETKSFYQKLAERDQEIDSLLDAVTQGKMRHASNKADPDDEIVPPESDAGIADTESN